MRARISKSQFKAKALEILRKVETTGESIVLTDHGKPTIEVRPYHGSERTPLEVLRGSVIEYIEPVDAVGEADWEILE